MLTEEQLEGIWIVDPIKGSRLASIEHHFRVHGMEVGANNLTQYLHKALAFKNTARNRNGRGREIRGLTPGVRRWEKQGKYIDLTSEGEIVS